MFVGKLDESFNRDMVVVIENVKCFLWVIGVMVLFIYYMGYNESYEWGVIVICGGVDISISIKCCKDGCYWKVEK